MSDYIDRQAAIDDILKHKNSVIEGCKAGSYTKQIYGMANDHVCELINILPSADVVPVVRCKDCKYRLGNYCYNKDGFAHSHYFFIQMDDYCSRGEMDEEEERVYCEKCKYNNGKSCDWHGTPIVVDGWCIHGRMNGGEKDVAQTED